MKQHLLNKISSFIIIVLTCSCQSDYTKLVKQELATGKKNDSIFFNLKFGQTQKHFYEVCWNYNKEGVLSHGPNNGYVQSFLTPKDTTKITERIQMLFYPKFDEEGLIRTMDIKFSYVAWAPWNIDLFADKLLPKIQDTLMKWYPGNKFMVVNDNILVKVDGGRQIQLKQETDKDVSVVIEDLLYKYSQLKNKD